MFSRYRISLARAALWASTVVIYWTFALMALPATRYSVYLGYEIFMDISARKKLSAIFADIGAVAARAHEAIAAAGSMPRELMVLPFVMALAMFICPLVVRRDYRSPVRGAFMLPFMTATTYMFTMMLNMILVALIELGLYFALSVTPGPDFFIFMTHPLYLLWPPAIGSIPGTASQFAFIVYIVSVLTLKSRHSAPREQADDAPSTPEPKPDVDDDVRACEMELDRLCRLMTGKFGSPAISHEVRSGVRRYLADARSIAEDVAAGMEHYRIVLLEAAKAMRRVIDESPDREHAGDAFCYIVDEMERMGYCTAQDGKTLRGWARIKTGCQRSPSE